MQPITTEPDAWSYIGDVAARLTAAGLDVTDHYAEEDDGHLSGLIEIGTDDEPQDHAYSWHTEHGWRELTGPRTDWGPYNNADDSLGADATVDEIVAKILGTPA